VIYASLDTWFKLEQNIGWKESRKSIHQKVEGIPHVSKQKCATNSFKRLGHICPISKKNVQNKIK